MQIIDCHCHAGPGDGFSGPYDTRAALPKFLKWSREAGIGKTILFAAFHSDYRVANQHVANIVNGYPSRFFGFAFVHAERDRGRVRSMINTAVNIYHFCGIKVHRVDARISREVCEVAREFSIPILYDVLGEVSTVELLAGEFPDVKFIIPHLGSFADDWKAQISFVPILSEYANIYTDTSGVRRFDVLEKAFSRAGASKILFGTDGPWLHPKVELEKIRVMGLSPADQEMVLSKNILKLIKKERPVSV